MLNPKTYFVWFKQARAQAQMFYMVSIKLELELFVWFRASSSSIVLYGFEQARAQTFCMVLSTLELELKLFFGSSKRPGPGQAGGGGAATPGAERPELV